MRTLCTILALLAFASSPSPAAEPADSAKHPGAPAALAELKIGDAAPPFSLRGIDDKMHDLAEYHDAKLLLITFISNHCPDSHAAEARLRALAEHGRAGGLKLVAINPNSSEGLSLDELGYSKYDDGFDAMKQYAAEQGFDFPYLYDGETQSTALAYGCQATPHVFLFDAERKLRYKGYLDDSRYADPATVKSADARKAVDALLAGQPVPVETTKPHGCSTKWNTKKAMVAEHMEKWDRTPVDVAPLDPQGAALLRQNGTKKIRLINVWATWCGPCVQEFPELVKTARRFDTRDFEFISISADEAKDEAKVKNFLERSGAGPSDRLKKTLKEEGRPSNSYLFTGSSINELVAALDSEWPGGLPHTILVGTKGEILWRHNGPINGEELRSKVLEILGPYYQP